MSKFDRALDAVLLPGVVWVSAWYVAAGVPVWAYAVARQLIRR